MADKPGLHGRDHRPGGADPFKSGNTASGYVLAADGSGETRWDAPATSGGSGIQFATDPQTGTWLLVTTTSTHTSGGSNNGIQLKSTGGDVSIYSSGAFNFIATGSGTTTIFADGLLEFGSTGDQVVIGASTSVSLVGNHNTYVQLLATLPDPFNNSFCVGPDSTDLTVGQFFRVDVDGSVHIKTGTSVVADL